MYNTTLAGWGNYPHVETTLFRPETIADLTTAFNEPKQILARGNGRSYGDASLCDKGLTISTLRFNRILNLDCEAKLVTVEAGATVQDVLEGITPYGLFLPVVPGTQLATIGGCIAADVHGKNQHHEGTFGGHVVSLLLRLADGTEVVVKRGEPAFLATIGGMGLTGMILEATIELKSAPTRKIMTEYRQCKDLTSTLNHLDGRFDDNYVVGWFDVLSTGKQLGRSVMMRGHHAEPEELALSGVTNDTPQVKAFQVPFNLPSLVLNRLTIKWFNDWYYERQRHVKCFISDYTSFFFPLDTVLGWNKLYGRNGFLQYQFVVDLETAETAIPQILRQLKKDRLLPFLAVIKKFGNNGAGLLSFCKPGITVALDIPIGGKNIEVIKERLRHCDEIVLRNNGRLYLAKDALMDREFFELTYKQTIEQWRKVKRDLDPNSHFTSLQAKRLGLA